MKAAQVLLLVVALVAALLAPAAEALRPCIEAPEGGLRAGGFTAREHDDPTIAEVTKFAYYELERNNPSVVKFVDAGCPKTQVVAGVMYSALIDVCTDAGALATYEVMVYEGFDRTKKLRHSNLREERANDPACV